LNSVGLIEVWLKKGEMIEKNPNPQEAEDNVFVSLRHDGPKNPEVEYRSTLYWHCGAATSGLNPTQEYFNSDLLSSVIVQIYVIPQSGIPVLYQNNYKVEAR